MALTVTFPVEEKKQVTRKYSDVRNCGERNRNRVVNGEKAGNRATEKQFVFSYVRPSTSSPHSPTRPAPGLTCLFKYPLIRSA